MAANGKARQAKKGRQWYRRCGRRISVADVTASKAACAESYRTGYLGTLKRAVNEQMAERVERMTLQEWANWSGAYTYRDSK